ncbi:MAG: protein-glutamate O-methyltransferase CheR [Gammaproteobacteria bacterium]|nr:MAG: protein-glutamate O-methyltransferase CheR [Gammaproteobacteria bacterium]
MTANLQWTAFLQWALPQLRMRWPGFRKVRTQVQKRIHKRLQVLQLADLAAYRHYLVVHPEEWRVLDTLCRITISRFYRDRRIYELLAEQVIPRLVEQMPRVGGRKLRIWCAGCSSGEEPYSLAIQWAMQLQQQYPDITPQILATDTDPQLLQRARVACYPYSSLKDLPVAWRESAFAAQAGRYCLKAEYKCPVVFVEHDVRGPVPATALSLILCRNLVYTYFETDLQYEITQRLGDALQPGGWLVLGSHEALPGDVRGFTPLSGNRAIYQKT